MHRTGKKNSIKNVLSDIHKEVDRGVVSDTNFFRRLELQRKLHDINQMEAKDSFQKSKIKWAIEGDENSKFFHGIINKKRSQLTIREVFDNGLWCTDPGKVNEALFNHFEARFKKHVAHRFMLNFPFNIRLSDMQAADLERNVSRDEIRLAVWNCGGINLLVQTDIRLSFLGNIGTLLVLILQILDGPFVLNEILHCCKRKKKQAMFFKADFAKVYDSVCWDYLLDVIEAFGSLPSKSEELPPEPTSTQGDSLNEFETSKQAMGVSGLSYHSKLAGSKCTGFMAKPKEEHMAVAKRVLGYIKGTINYELYYKKDKSQKLRVFTDSNYARDLEDRKSTFGYICLFNGAAICWSSPKHKVITLSTTEAEYVAATTCACHCVWLTDFLEELEEQAGTVEVINACEDENEIDLYEVSDDDHQMVNDDSSQKADTIVEHTS
nr:retrovirus-related Pol polyprotein from transposon TNT 1-94 [Tanacetum cinerariifolium]